MGTGKDPKDRDRAVEQLIKLIVEMRRELERRRQERFRPARKEIPPGRSGAAVRLHAIG